MLNSLLLQIFACIMFVGFSVIAGGSQSYLKAQPVGRSQRQPESSEASTCVNNTSKLQSLSGSPNGEEKIFVEV